MSFIVQYEEEHEIEVLPAPDNTWQSINIRDYMDDPTALGVVLRTTSHPDTGVSGVRNSGSSMSDLLVNRVGAPTHMHSIASLNGTGVLELFRETPAVDVTLYITAEIHDFAVFQDDEIYHIVQTNNDLNVWRPIQITPKPEHDFSDIAAVITRVIGFGGPDFGLRAIGDDPALRNIKLLAGQQWYLTETDDNGIFETYASGKVAASPSAWLFEVGYLLKNSGVVLLGDTPTIDLAIESDWGEMDLSSLIPSDGFAAGIFINNAFLPSANKAGYVKATGASQPPRRQVQASSGVTPTVLLDAEQKCEYRKVVEELEFRLLWYESAIPPILGLAKGTAEAYAAVDGTAEARAAVAGTAEASAARKV